MGAHLIGQSIRGGVSIQSERNRKKTPDYVLLANEASFTKRGVYNFHNEHVYKDENPHAIIINHFQHEIKIIVWAERIGNNIIGFFIFSHRLTGYIYLQHLLNTMPNLLEDLPLELRRTMWFMYDGTLATDHNVLRT